MGWPIQEWKGNVYIILKKFKKIYKNTRNWLERFDKYIIHE